MKRTVPETTRVGTDRRPTGVTGMTGRRASGEGKLLGLLAGLALVGVEGLLALARVTLVQAGGGLETEMLEEACKVLGQRGLDGDPALGHGGVAEVEGAGVQAHAGVCLAHGPHLLEHLGHADAVLGVADHGRGKHVGGVDADLVLAAAERAEADERGDLAQPLQHSELGGRRFAGRQVLGVVGLGLGRGGGGHLGLEQAQPQRRLDAALVHLRGGADQRPVGLGDAPLGELVVQKGGNAARLGDQQHPAGVLVEAVHQPALPSPAQLQRPLDALQRAAALR